MSSGNSYAQPGRPQRPAFLSLDINDTPASDGSYFPSMPNEGQESPATHDFPFPPNPFRNSVDAPAIVRSFSGDAREPVFRLSHIRDSVDSAQYVEIPTSFSRARDSLNTPSPISPSGLQSRSRGSRSPLACPPSLPLSPAETYVGSPDPEKEYFMQKVKKVPFKTNALDVERDPIDKPWLREKKNPLDRIAYWLTYAGILFMACCSALIVLANLSQVEQIGNLCLVLDDDFSNGLNRDTWFHEVDMGGFGNGEFEMVTDSTNNSYVEDGVLYLVPTLTSDVIGKDAIFNGYTYNISECTNANLTQCGKVSNASLQSVINPAQSARIHTRYSHSITYGRVEVRARLPRGDWLWPAIWMMPVDYAYGPWPMSGEIDIMESRGNGPEYPYEGRNFVRSSLNWGPNDIVNAMSKTTGFFTQRRTDFSDDFHTYVLEWSPTFLKAYVDTPMHPMFDIRFNKPFFDRGDFGTTALNGTAEVAISNPWAVSGTNSAPFDQSFYLILNVAVGGRNGWFPDTVGGKMWYDEQDNSMYEFARAQEKWSSTWPDDPKRRGMAVEHVKMWQRC